MDSTTQELSQQRVLAIETSTVACSVALQVGNTIDQIHHEIPRTHNQEVLGMVRDLLKRNGLRVRELTAICFGRGPGSFTGTRIAAAVTQGLALPFELPVYSISSLQSLASRVFSEYAGARGILSFIKSRPGEYYRGTYAIQEGGLRESGAEIICRADNLFRHTDIQVVDINAPDWVVVFDDAAFDKKGEGLSILSHADHGMALLGARPDAAGLLNAPRSSDALVDIASAVPIYLQGTSPWKKTRN
ncbi:MAG: tRNA (adenosine(37)-N6)-threonylcarbamoyltransferase complex dimerization subunit type 1 TsaB [Pseudomonadales bacterium]|nr:tRNA (adenosine(37)-N6)-threonylcarbamoyltransferase complex dimerization subunit type 1 TsaB [Pseudomonadales bacterium]